MKKFVLTLLLCLGLGSSLANAASCGPGTGKATCECGDVVNGSYTMPANLTCTTGSYGLRVASGATLNCDNHTITGNRTNDTWGIYFDGAVGGIARNCFVTAFERGFRINGGSGNLIEDSDSYNNSSGAYTNFAAGSYGIDIGSTEDNIIQRVTVYGNADEGIHIGSNANRTVVRSSEVCGNAVEDLYVLENTGTQVIYTTAGHDCYGYTAGANPNEGANSLYMKHGDNACFISNTFNKSKVHVTGDSNGTYFLYNTFADTYQEDCYTPDTPDTCPSGTTTVATPVNPPGHYEAFCPEAPQINLIHPAGGESYPANSVQQITWTSHNLPSNVRVWIRMVGQEAVLLNGQVANTGTKSWTTPATPGQYRMRISANPIPRVATDLGAIFTITP